MSHVNRQNQDTISALYDVHIMVCRLLMLSQMSPQDNSVHDLPVTFVCLLSLVIVKRNVELYVFNIFIQMKKGTTVLFLISPSKHSLCFFEESCSLKLDKENWKHIISESKKSLMCLRRKYNILKKIEEHRFKKGPIVTHGREGSILYCTDISLGNVIGYLSLSTQRTSAEGIDISYRKLRLSVPLYYLLNVAFGQLQTSFLFPLL